MCRQAGRRVLTLISRLPDTDDPRPESLDDAIRFIGAEEIADEFISA